VTRLILALCILASPALAAPQCALHDAMKAILAHEFDEHPVAMGLAQDNTIMQLYAADAGTWTLTVTSTNGMTCMVVAGEGYETFAPVPAGVPG